MKTCGMCKEEESLDKFCKDKSKPNGFGRCKACQKIMAKKHYDKNSLVYKNRQEVRRKEHQQKVQKIKELKKCNECGDDRHYVLDFHHKNPKDKSFGIGENLSCNFEKILGEIDKCIVLCSNCHKEFHYFN